MFLSSFEKKNMLLRRRDLVALFHCIIVVVFLSVFCVSFFDAMGWFVVCDCGISRSRGYKTFFITQLSTKFIMLINVKMPTIVGILTFMSMINTTFERPKARNFFSCRYFSFYEQMKFRA